ncbi:MAG: response regulator [Terriglobales bacterium]
MPAKRPTVVVAESEEGLRNSIAAVFKMLGGWRVFEAATVSEAASLILRYDPDLVLTDDLFEDGNGCDLSRQFKASGFWRALPFIMWAGHEVPAERLHSAGIDLFLFKPIAVPVLINYAKELIADYAAFKRNLARPPRRRRPRNMTANVFSVTRFSRTQL